MPERRFLIVAGDPSGDRHAAALARQLRAKDPTVCIAALGGDHLKAVSDQFLYPLVGLGGFGFWEPVMKLPELWRARQAVKRCINEWKPEAVIPVDFYGFNIHVARAAKAAGIPAFYYVSPQVWASRSHRIQALKDAVKRMLVIFPFEKTLYEKSGVPVTFVGHPLPERLPTVAEPMEPPMVGLLPGSRPSVIARHMPILVGAAALLRQRHPLLRIALFRPNEIPASFYAPFLAKAPWAELTVDPDYNLRRSLKVAIGVSGTAALENMLLGIPMVIMYRLSWLTYQIAKRLIRVSHVGLPNLLAGESLIPELLQNDATPEAIAAAADGFLTDKAKWQTTRQRLLDLRATLQDGGSSRAADTILAR